MATVGVSLINCASIKYAYYNTSGTRVPKTDYNTQTVEYYPYSVGSGKNFYIHSCTLASGYNYWQLYKNDSFVKGGWSGTNITYNVYPTSTTYLDVRGVTAYIVTVSAGTGGSVSGGGTYLKDTTAVITATPSAGYVFDKWSDGSTVASRSFPVTKNVALTASFKVDSYSYTITYYPNGGTGSAITDTVSGSASTFNTYLRGLTYTKAYNTQTGWHESASVTHGLGDLISISGNKTMYATWTHDTTSNFYWFGNDTLDGQKIFTGTLISNLTATAWKSIGTKINQLESLLGDTQTTFTTSMTSGTVFLASYYNEVTGALRRIINNHSLNISAPNDTQKGNRLFYYLFNGAASVKTCLNNIIQWYNTR